MRMKRLKKGHLVKNDALLRWLVGWFLFFSILVPQKVPRSLPVHWYTNKGHDVVKMSQFLHDVTASAACQTCHPVGTRCLSASQRQQTYIHTHTRALTQSRTLCQMIRLIHMTGKPGLKRLKACLCRHGVADLVDSLRSYPTPFRVASSPNKSPRMLLDVHSFTWEKWPHGTSPKLF